MSASRSQPWPEREQRFAPHRTNRCGGTRTSRCYPTTLAGSRRVALGQSLRAESMRSAFTNPRPVAGCAARRGSRALAALPNRGTRRRLAADRFARAQQLAALLGRSPGDSSCSKCNSSTPSPIRAERTAQALMLKLPTPDKHIVTYRRWKASSTAASKRQAPAHQHGQSRAQHDDAHLRQRVRQRRHSYEYSVDTGWITDRDAVELAARKQKSARLPSPARYRRRRRPHLRPDLRVASTVAVTSGDGFSRTTPRPIGNSSGSVGGTSHSLERIGSSVSCEQLGCERVPA